MKREYKFYVWNVLGEPLFNRRITTPNVCLCKDASEKPHSDMYKINPSYQGDLDHTGYRNSTELRIREWIRAQMRRELYSDYFQHADKQLQMWGTAGYYDDYATEEPVNPWPTIDLKT